MGDSMYDNTPTSRFEEGMRAMIDGTPWPDRPPKSKMESLLKELNDTIKEGGGGGGGTSNYNLLENLPLINSITLKGDKSLADLGIIAEIKKAMDMITGYFDNTVDYSAGDIVVYDKKLYKFTVDHTAGDWNNLEVSQTTVEELLSGIVDGVTSALALKADKSELPDVATASDVGLVKPDGSSITVDANGVLTAVGGGGSSDPYDGRKVRYTISASSWSSSPNSDGYYTYSLTLTKALSTNTSPNVYIAGASDSTQPTATENTMFSYVKRCNLSSTTTLVLYASTKPTSTFYVFVGAEGGSINYSTTEQDTGLIWIDGKKIYQKTYSLTLTNNNPQAQTGYFEGSYWDGLVTPDKVAETIVGVDIVYTYVEPSDNLTYTKSISPHNLDAWVQRPRHNSQALSLNAYHWSTSYNGAIVYFTVRYTKV